MWKSRKLAETNHLTKFRCLFRTHPNNIDRTISAKFFTLDVNRVMRTPWRPHIESKTEPKFTNTKNHEHLQFLKSILSESTHKTLKGLLNNVFVKCKEKTLLENNCWLTLLIWDHHFISCVANDSKLQHKKCHALQK